MAKAKYLEFLRFAQNDKKEQNVYLAQNDKKEQNMRLAQNDKNTCASP